VRAPIGQGVVFCHDGRRVDDFHLDFHLLEHFGFAPRKQEPAAAVGAAARRAGLEVVDRLRRERLAQVLLVPRLSALLPLLAALGWRLLGLDEVARRRLGGGGGVLAGGGQFLLQPSVLLAQALDLCSEPRVFLFQLRVAFHDREELFLPLGHALGQPVMVAVALWFPQLPKAGQYASLAARSRPIARPANTTFRQILRGGA